MDALHAERQQTDALAAVLAAIVAGAVHPEIAVRRVIVDLAPIRHALAALARHRAGSGVSNG